MAILKKQLPKQGKVTIEVYEWQDPNMGWGHGETLGFIKVDVAELEDNKFLEGMVNVPQKYLDKYDEGIGVGYDIITEDEIKELHQNIDDEIKRLEELKRNLFLG